MAPRGRTWKHVCKKCNKSFPSGRALGGHMSRHWRMVEQPKRMPRPPASVVDVHVLLLSPSDEETLLPSSRTQRPSCSKVFSSCNSQRMHMRKHSEKKVLNKPVEEAAGLMEALAVADGGYNVVLSPSVKRKRSKRESPALNFGEMDAAVTLLLLSEHSKKISAYEDCCAEDMGSLPPNVSKDVKLNAFGHLLVRSAEFKKPKGHKCSAYDDYYGQCEKDDNLIPNLPKNSADEDCYGQYENENILVYYVPNKDSNVAHNVSEKDDTLIPNVLKDNTSIPNVPKSSAYKDCYGQYEEENILFHNAPKDSNVIHNVPEKDNILTPNVPREVELIVLDDVLAEDSELRKPRTDNYSVEMKCGDLSAAMKVKRHDCNACTKSFGSGQALGGHMRWHRPRSNYQRQGFAHCPESVLMEEQMQKPELDSKLLDPRIPALTDRHYIFSGLKSTPEPWPVSSRVH
uniref:Uncharacterized protein n=2 Tax=Avena sativa TaxID=4498 RepID=A0ACD5YM92_AVESA